jgi:sugar O-acyltransferase (sialic acid O-acetyltransferase NeuD family)
LVLFGAGGPLGPDLEESCRRAGRPLAAILRNRPVPDVALDGGLVQDASARFAGAAFLCPLFTPANRRIAVAEAAALGLVPAPALLDPTAILAASASFGDGCYINAGAIIGAAARFGRFVIVNRAASLGHHAEVGDFASVGPGAVIAGQVRIGAGVLIGAGAIVAPGLALGECSVLGPGAVLLRDLPAGATALGNPARIGRAA